MTVCLRSRARRKRVSLRRSGPSATSSTVEKTTRVADHRATRKASGRYPTASAWELRAKSCTLRKRLSSRLQPRLFTREYSQNPAVPKVTVKTITSAAPSRNHRLFIALAKSRSGEDVLSSADRGRISRGRLIASRLFNPSPVWTITSRICRLFLKYASWRCLGKDRCGGIMHPQSSSAP